MGNVGLSRFLSLTLTKNKISASTASVTTTLFLIGLL